MSAFIELKMKWASGKVTTDLEKAILASEKVSVPIAEDAAQELVRLRKIEVAAGLMADSISHYFNALKDAFEEYEKAVEA